MKPGEAYYLHCLRDVVWQIKPQGAVTEFVYDGDGERVKKIVAAEQSSAEITCIGSLFENRLSVNGNRLSVKHIFAGANRICTVTKDEGTGTTDEAYYHSDHLGSSNVIIDQTGQLSQVLEYLLYGETQVNTGIDIVNHKFTGKELDNTGLYFYGARYYLKKA